MEQKITTPITKGIVISLNSYCHFTGNLFSQFDR